MNGLSGNQQTPVKWYSRIAGAEPETVATLENRSPFDTADLIGTVHLAGPAAWPAAAEVSRRAQQKWASRPAPERAHVLEAIARRAGRRRDDLAELIVRETGKPLRQAYFEAGEFAGMFNFYAHEILRPTGAVLSSSMANAQLTVAPAPLGVVALITSINYPLAVPIWSIAPALAMGNSVIWKPDSESASVVAAIMDILEDSELPAGLVSTILCAPDNAEAGLTTTLEQGLVDQVSFTGSTEVGRRLAGICGHHLIAPLLQLSGNMPMVVAADADLDAAVEAVRESAFGVNQGNTSVANVIVHESLHAEFVVRLDRGVTAMTVGNPREGADYGPMMCRRFADRFEKALGSLASHHAVLGSTAVGRITAASPREGFLGDPASGLFYHPSIVDGVGPDDEIFLNETLGPIVGISTFSTLPEAADLAQRSGYGSMVSLFTANPLTVDQFRSRTNFGLLAVNRPPSKAGETRLPYGGVGRSGNNTRAAGPWALESFARWQAISWRFDTSSN